MKKQDCEYQKLCEMKYKPEEKYPCEIEEQEDCEQYDSWELCDNPEDYI